MATRGMVDASIGSFWATVGSPRPTTPRDLIRRQSRPRGQRGACSSVPASARKTGGSGEAERESEAPPEFRPVAVELSGREGFNALAVNGLWRYWRVKNGRLAFRRDAELQADRDGDEDGEAAAPGGLDATGGPRGGRAVAVRLYLFYLPQADAWLVSDSPDVSGSVLADCGPVAGAQDFGQHWRVWDGEAWKEDRNITAEIFLGGPPPPALQGLRVVAGAAAQAAAPARAHSQEAARPPPPPILPRPPLTARPPDSARISRTPRPPP